MLSDRDFKRCAVVMITQFGTRAAAKADMRAEELQRRGDPSGHDTWRQVAATIRQLGTDTRAVE